MSKFDCQFSYHRLSYRCLNVWSVSQVRWWMTAEDSRTPDPRTLPHTLASLLKRSRFLPLDRCVCGEERRPQKPSTQLRACVIWHTSMWSRRKEGPVHTITPPNLHHRPPPGLTMDPPLVVPLHRGPPDLDRPREILLVWVWLLGGAQGWVAHLQKSLCGAPSQSWWGRHLENVLTCAWSAARPSVWSLAWKSTWGSIQERNRTRAPCAAAVSVSLGLLRLTSASTQVRNPIPALIAELSFVISTACGSTAARTPVKNRMCAASAGNASVACSTLSTTSVYTQENDRVAAHSAIEALKIRPAWGNTSAPIRGSLERMKQWGWPVWEREMEDPWMMRIWDSGCGGKKKETKASLWWTVCSQANISKKINILVL